MYKYLAFITCLFISLNLRAAIHDETNTLTPEGILRINEITQSLEKEFKTRFEIHLLSSFEGLSEKNKAREMFIRDNLKEQDLVLVVSLKERRSRFWIGTQAQENLTKSRVRLILDSAGETFKEKKHFQAFLFIAEQVFQSFKSPPEKLSQLEMIVGGFFMTIFIAGICMVESAFKPKNTYYSSSNSSGCSGGGGASCGGGGCGGGGCGGGGCGG